MDSVDFLYHENSPTRVGIEYCKFRCTRSALYKKCHPDERESIADESLTSFPEENVFMPSSGFEPKPIRLQAEGHIQNTG
ncbi:hypothetical protein TNCV_430021 [Trichonephila clavipes]|nr:hypothetical protein TNCV_430021 [Trichonephila clavipes]